MNQIKTLSTTRAIACSIAVASFLAVAKFCVGLLTQSMAVLASALDSFMDAGVSTVNLVAAREASKPPDEEHAYGHGKIESLASLLQSQIIIASGLYLIFESVRRIVTGGQLAHIPLGYAVMGLSLFSTLGLVIILRRAAGKKKSLILDTEALHYATDLASNLAVIAALVLVQVTGQVIWDLLLCIGVGIYVFRAAAQIFRRSVDELLDKSLGPVQQDEIEKKILNHDPSIVGLHDFRSHRVGDRIFLDFHIEIRGVDEFRRAHRIAESVIERLHKDYEGADITVHYDPEGET